MWALSLTVWLQPHSVSLELTCSTRQLLFHYVLSNMFETSQPEFFAVGDCPNTLHWLEWLIIIRCPRVGPLDPGPSQTPFDIISGSSICWPYTDRRNQVCAILSIDPHRFTHLYSDHSLQRTRVVSALSLLTDIPVVTDMATSKESWSTLVCYRKYYWRILYSIFRHRSAQNWWVPYPGSRQRRTEFSNRLWQCLDGIR